MFSEERNMDGIEEFSDLIHEGEGGLEGWIVRNCVADMKRWMELTKNDSPNHNTKQLLSKYCSLDGTLLANLKDSNKAYEVSSLSMVLLARIATVCSDSALSASLTAALSETYDVIRFVERKMRFTSFENKKKYVLAKAAMEAPSSRDVLLKVFNISDIEASQFNNDIHHVIDVLGRLKGALPDDIVKDEMEIITEFIRHRNLRSIQQIHDYIEHLFVDMLNEFLTQVPNAIYKEITESSPEDYEKAMRFSLKLLCKVESVEAFVQ
ncbi:hypothetical protein Sjap_026195 [Stephania japonica]|uniref:Uncharacterized protein n=1 Tax=Stephania japonica TaxID=461633 RepID=A0AAP0HG93_9MAGN